MITVSKASRTYENLVVWENIDAQFLPGSVTSITGPSGCGKSTLLNCIGLIDQLSSGEITIEGQSTSGLNKRQRRRIRQNKLGYLFQDYALIEDATVAENISLAIAYNTPRKKRSKVVDQVLEQVGLESKKNDYIYTLSGGQQQRVGLARILAKKPTIVLADEPTGALDNMNAQLVIDQLKSMATDGATVIVATHNLDIVAQSDHCLKIDEF